MCVCACVCARARACTRVCVCGCFLYVLACAFLWVYAQLVYTSEDTFSCSPDACPIFVCMQSRAQAKVQNLEAELAAAHSELSRLRSQPEHLHFEQQQQQQQQQGNRQEQKGIDHQQQQQWQCKNGSREDRESDDGSRSCVEAPVHACELEEVRCVG